MVRALSVWLALSLVGLTTSVAAAESAQIPTGVAMNELGVTSAGAAEVQARGALVQASLRGGEQGGIASVPASVTYVVLSVFMGGAAVPRDLTFPAESVK